MSCLRFYFYRDSIMDIFKILANTTRNSLLLPLHLPITFWELWEDKTREYIILIAQNKNE